MKKYFRHLLVLAGIFTGSVFSIEVKAQDFIDEDFLENIETNAKFVLTDPVYTGEFQGSSGVGTKRSDFCA